MKEKNAVLAGGVNKKFKQKGATLLEALSFLAISAVIVIGATSLLKSAFGSSDVNQHLREIISVKTGIKSYLTGQGNFNGATNANLIAAGMIPSTLNVSGSTISNSFGGNVTIAPAGTPVGANYSITTTNVDKEACVKLVPSLSGFLGVQIGSAAEVTSFPYSAAQVVTDCGAGPVTIVVRGN